MVLVYSIDRFGRNLKQSLTNADKIEEDNGILLVSATENFSNDPSGRFFRNVMMAHAQYYSDELLVKIKHGPPNKLKANPFPLGDGFAFIVYFRTYIQAMPQTVSRLWLNIL